MLCYFDMSFLCLFYCVVIIIVISLLFVVKIVMLLVVIVTYRSVVKFNLSYIELCCRCHFFCKLFFLDNVFFFP
nr:MAG TPA: hypothetical protein [Caudoviricetes sp.]